MPHSNEGKNPRPEAKLLDLPNQKCSAKVRQKNENAKLFKVFLNKTYQKFCSFQGKIVILQRINII